MRRGLALMNVTAWVDANTTEAMEAWLGVGLGRGGDKEEQGWRYDEDRYALPPVQSATANSVQ